MRIKYLIAAALLCSAGAAADAHKWLTRINDAAVNLNYEGVFVYGYESSLETMRVVHQVGEDGVIRERVYALNGAPREIIRDAERVWCYAPEQKIGVHEYRQAQKQNFPNILPPSLEHVHENYRLKSGRTSRVADRKAQQILIVPRDEYRYGYSLWADEETGLLLKATIVDGDGKPVEQYMFTQVDIGVSIPDDALLPLTPKENLQWFGVGGQGDETPYADLDEPGWSVGQLPDGFSVSRRIRRFSPVRNSMMEQYVYSDGLAAVSVFIEMMDEGSSPRIEGLSRMGAVHAFGHSQDGYHITVVGEVPSATVDLIGMSVTRVSQ